MTGDFNQNRDESDWYEDAKLLKKRSSALDQLSLQCVTKIDMRANGLARATVDHFCLSRSIASELLSIGAWEGTAEDGYRMSDHNGVFINID